MNVMHPGLFSKHRLTLSFSSLWMLQSAKMQLDSRLVNNSCQRGMVKNMSMLVTITMRRTKMWDVMGCSIAIRWMYLVNLPTTAKIRSVFGSGGSKQGYLMCYAFLSNK